MHENMPAVEVRLSCRVERGGLATLRRDPERPHLVRLAIGSDVRFTIAAEDIPAVLGALEHARLADWAAITLADGEGFYLRTLPRPWHANEDVFRRRSHSRHSAPHRSRCSAHHRHDGDGDGRHAVPLIASIEKPAEAPLTGCRPERES